MLKAHPPYYLVIGLGASGMSMARFLNHIGESVVATDLDGSKQKEAKQLEELGIKTQIGFHDQETFNGAKVLVPSPGIPLTSKYIQTALKAGVSLSGELDIFFKYNTLPVIAITGTNGKTTTTTLIGDMLNACGRNVFVGGNIGTPLVELLLTKQKADIVVAEISSFQLDISNNFKPDIGVLLNISEDHLDRYSSFKEYEQSKWSLFARQNDTDTAIINAALTGSKNHGSESVDNIPTGRDLKSALLTFSSQKSKIPCSASINSSGVNTGIDINFKDRQYKIDTAELHQLSGTHNHENIAAATLACLSAGEDMENILKGLKNFKNLSHRMEKVKTIKGVSFYNDSKATNTDAVIRAIQCFEQDVVVILGGREKGTDFSLLKPVVQEKVKTIIALGESKQKVTDTFKTICPVIEATNMKEAVQSGFNAADTNEIVLLSPACASFDMYESYAHRGDDFKNHVKQLKGA